MAIFCWELGCKHNNMRETCSFFHFPTNPEERTKWLLNLKRQGEPKLWTRLCSCHFPDGKKENGPTKCQTYAAGTPQEWDKRLFRRRSIDMETHQCPKCSYESEWSFQVDHHVRREHTDVYAAKLFRAIDEPEQFSCVCCDFNGYYRCDLYEHYKHNIHHGNNIDKHMTNLFRAEESGNFACGHCAYKSDSCLSLVKHVTESCETKAKQLTKIDRKTRIQVSGEGANWLQCAKCSFKSRNKSNLATHMVIHASSEEIVWHQCTTCSFKSKWKAALKRHVLLKHSSNEDINWFECVKCSYKSKEKRHLSEHVMMKHTSSEDIDWFDCAQCSYKSKTKRNLTQHVTLQHASSDEIVWFECAKCSYKSKQKSHLKQHVTLTHDVASEDIINRFRCTTCPFKSKWKSALKQHMLQHASSADIDWYECAKCPYKAKNKNNLMRHMLKHAAYEDVDWYECAKCSYKAKTKYQLKQHAIKHAFDEDTSTGSNAQSVRTRPSQRVT